MTLQAEPQVAAVVLGDDTAAFQELLKEVFQVRRPAAPDRPLLYVSIAS